MTVNGKSVEYQPITLLAYLEREGYNISHIVVERQNASIDASEIITRERFGEVTLREDDDINILRFMGGG